MKADLHVHSTASDGTLTPCRLVALALERGLSHLAIADHDSVAGLPEAIAAAAGTSLTVIPAVELSAVSSGLDIHVLGYFVDYADEELQAQLTDLRQARAHRAQRMVQALNAAGYPLTLDDVIALTDGGAIGRSHIARALVSRGHAATVREAFEHFIGRDQPFYVSKDVRTPADVITTIHGAGGIAIVAHPGISGLDELLDDLVTDGLDGVEAFHSEHDSEQTARYAHYAAEKGLLTSGGTDFHGPAAPNPPLGSNELPEAALEALLAAAAARR